MRFILTTIALTSLSRDILVRYHNHEQKGEKTYILDIGNSNTASPTDREKLLQKLRPYLTNNLFFNFSNLKPGFKRWFDQIKGRCDQDIAKTINEQISTIQSVPLDGDWLDMAINYLSINETFTLKDNDVEIMIVTNNRSLIDSALILPLTLLAIGDSDHHLIDKIAVIDDSESVDKKKRLECYLENTDDINHLINFYDFVIKLAQNNWHNEIRVNYPEYVDKMNRMITNFHTFFEDVKLVDAARVPIEIVRLGTDFLKQHKPLTISNRLERGNVICFTLAIAYWANRLITPFIPEISEYIGRFFILDKTPTDFGELESIKILDEKYESPFI